MRLPVLASSVALLLIAPGASHALDLAIKGYGLSLGNSRGINGLRINLIDEGLRQVKGVNLTLWNPGDNPYGEVTGAAIGLIAPSARTLNGLALGGIATAAQKNINGIALAGLGAGAGGSITGAAFGLAGVGAGEDLTGLVVAGLGAGVGGSARGVILGGIGAGAGQDITGIALGGIGAGAGRDLTGLVFGLASVRAGDSITGAAGSIVSVASPEVRGITVAALNGIGFESHLRPKRVNERHTGIALGIVNHSWELHGVQIGLLNHAANNPPWARWLPFVNAHL